MAGGAFWLPLDGASTLDDLSDVDTTTTTPTEGQALVYDAGSGVWRPGDATAAAGRWEVLVTGNPAEAITTADGTDWLYTWITEET